MNRGNKRFTAGSTLALILSGTLLLACGGAEESSYALDDLADGKKPPPTSVRLAFADSIPTGAFTPLTQAYIDSTPAVYVVADWTSVTTAQSEHQNLISPEGSLYYGTDISFADQSTSLVTSFALPDGTRRVVFKLLIWGTTIESYHDSGTWTANVNLVNGTVTGTTTIELL